MSKDNGLSPATLARWRESPLGARTEALEFGLLLDNLGPVKGLRVLDVGCGDGLLVAKLSAAGADTFGIDPDRAMVRAAAERGTGFVLAAMGDKLPFPDATFDRVSAITFLCNASGAHDIVTEMARVLRPGGRLILGDLGSWSFWSLARRLRGLLGNRLWRNAHFHSPAGLRRLIEAAGLSPGPCMGAVYFPPSALAARFLAPIDKWIARHLGAFGAAFLVLVGEKPLEN